jgi:protein-disulfide isomerase
VHQRHALRMLLLATRLASAGATNTEIDTALNRYYAGFAAPRARFTVDPSLCRGPEDAAVTLVEFSDFECPYCRAAAPLLEGLISEAGPVRLCFKPFPLKQHAHATPAAEAALFARAHGKFWAMHDLLFTHQDNLEAADLRRYAEELELDPEGLARALELHVFSDALEASKAEGKRANVASTPSVYLDGRSHDLALSVAELHHSIDDELEWQSHSGHWAPK